jgi:cytochrome c-type biogenesis protein CcmH
MIGFVLAIFLLMAAAVLLLLWPLKVPRHHSLATATNESRTQANVQLYQQRLADILDDQAQGLLDAETADALRNELQKQLLDDAPTLKNPQALSRSRSQLVFITALLVPVLALFVYSRIGEPEAWTIPLLIKQSEQAYAAGVDNSSQLNQLTAQLSQFPQRDEFASLQARILMQLQKYSEAAIIFSQLQQRFPDDAGLVAQSVQARYLANDRQFDDAMSVDAKHALQLDPNQPTLLGLLGMRAFEDKRYADAVNYWQQLVTILPPESAQADVIQGPLKRARELAGLEVNKESVNKESDGKDVGDKNSAAINPAIKVSVSLAGNFKIPVNAILFVFAKSAAVGAPPMPLAVQRIPSPTLPLTVSLDDSLAMMPSLKLSSVDEVIITARLSTSGDVRGNPDDLQIVTQPIKWRELKQAVELTLSPAK